MADDFRLHAYNSLIESRPPVNDVRLAIPPEIRRWTL
jgi:hypothetical protein